MYTKRRQSKIHSTNKTKKFFGSQYEWTNDIIDERIEYTHKWIDDSVTSSDEHWFVDIW